MTRFYSNRQTLSSCRPLSRKIGPEAGKIRHELRVADEREGKADHHRFGVAFELDLEAHLVVGDAFNPGVGYVRRGDMHRNFVEGRFSPRPRSDRVRKYSWTGSIDYIENGVGQMETRAHNGEFVRADWSRALCAQQERDGAVGQSIDLLT